MRRVAMWFVSLALLSGAVACGDGEPETAGSSASPSAAAVPGPGQHELTLDHGGVTRRYRVHAPPSYRAEQPTPLVIALHQYPGSGQGLSQAIGMDEVAARENFLVAYPDGVNRGFNALVCCGTADDVGFLTALTEHMVGTWRVDPDRVFLTGISNGGDLSFRAAVEATGRFAAIGVASGGFIGERAAAADYAPKSPVSVITFIGGRDGYADDFKDGIEAWQKRLKCSPVKPAPAAPSASVSLSRARCGDGSDVEVYELAEMGHAWPGARSGSIAAPDAGIMATELIWEFFAAHPRQR